MGKAIQAYEIPRRKLIIMTKCYRVTCDQENFDVGCKVAMHDDLAGQSKDYTNQWGMYNVTIIPSKPSESCQC
jgi:hypothetical protein